MKRIPSLALLLTLSLPLMAQRARIDSLLIKVQRDLPDTIAVRVNYQLGKDYLRISGDSSVLFITRALQLAQKLGDKKREAESYSVLGATEKSRANYEKALTYHLKALKIKEEIGDEQSLAIAYNDIGQIYKVMARYREALVYYRRANELSRKINLAKGMSMTYNNIGTVHREMGVADSALYYYRLGLAEAEKMGDGYSISTCLSNIGDVLLDGAKYEEALHIFQRCLAFDKANEDKQGIIMSYMNLARVFTHLNQYDKGTKLADSAYALSLDEDLVTMRLEVMRTRIYMEKTAGQFQKAVALQERYILLKDSVMNQETTNQISELQTKYETQKKESQIALQRSEISRKNYIIAGISIFLVLSALLGYSSYRRYRLKQQAKLQAEILHQQELATFAVIEAEERERKRIASDLHDGVGQLMSAAKMNLSVIGSELDFDSQEQKESFDKVMDLVDEGCREVRSVSHNIMPNALLKSGLATATREFISKIDRRVLKVNLYTEGLNERIDGSIESVLYRVIQESVNNVIKHSGADTLDISLIKDEEGISCTIEDNGQGFDTNDKSKFRGIGIKNIRSRVEYLKGSVEWDAAPGKGTVVTIHVPVAATPQS